MNRFSIILPVKNGGKYLQLCVNSILRQSVQDFNLIVLDNNSTDGSGDWLRSLCSDKIIIYPSQVSLSIEENWGRITGIEKNEFMTMIGHDDILLPNYLSEFEQLITKHPEASLYQSHFDYIDGNGKLTRKCLPMDEIQTAHEFLACQMNETINSTGTGYMMRSEAYDKLNGIPVSYPNLIFADYELWIKLTLKSYKATSLNKCFLYREHLSVSRITNGMLYQAAFSRYVEFLMKLKSQDSLSASVIDSYAQRFLLKFCESLAHRLLKTPVNLRSISVKQLIENFKIMAENLIPGQQFDPMSISRIRYAVEFDRSGFHRSIFRFIKSF